MASQSAFATSIVDLADADVAWDTPSNAAASDDAYAEISGFTLATADSLVASGFGFSVPTDAIIVGVKFELECQNGALGHIHDNNVQLVVSGTPTGNNLSKVVTDEWTVSGVDVIRTFGGTNTIWGVGTLTPAIVNASNFGVVYQAVEVGGIEASIAMIDSMKVTVYYATASTLPTSYGDPYPDSGNSGSPNTYVDMSTGDAFVLFAGSADAEFDPSLFLGDEEIPCVFSITLLETASMAFSIYAKVLEEDHASGTNIVISGGGETLAWMSTVATPADGTAVIGPAGVATDTDGDAEAGTSYGGPEINVNGFVGDGANSSTTGTYLHDIGGVPWDAGVGWDANPVSWTLAGGDRVGVGIVSLPLALTGGGTDTSYAQAFRLTGQITSNQSRDLRTTGRATSSQPQDLRISGVNGSNRPEDLRVTGQATNSRAQDFRVTGTIVSSQDRGFRLQGQATSSRSQDFRVTGQLSDARAQDLRIQPQAVTSQAQDFRVTSQLSSFIAQDLRIFGQVLASQAQDLRIFGTTASSQSQDFRITGQLSSLRENDFRVTGASGSSRAQDARITGQNTDLTSRDLRATGQATNSRSQDLRLTSQSSASQAQDLRISAQSNSVLQTQDLRVVGQASSNLPQDFRVIGQATATSAQDLALTGQSSSVQSRDLRISGVFASSTSVTLRIDPLTGNATLELGLSMTGKLESAVEIGLAVIGFRPKPISFGLPPQRLTSLSENFSTG